MFNPLFAIVGRVRGLVTKGRRRRAGHRGRLGLELLEDRLVLSATPALMGVQTQALANPTNTVTAQVIVAGSFQTVANQVVTIAPGSNGLLTLAFQAQAFSGITNRVGVRYLIDGAIDTNDASVNFSGTTADTIEDIPAGSWQTLTLTHVLGLVPGTHVISVQMEGTSLAIQPGQELVVYTPVLNLVSYNAIDGRNAAVDLQTQTVTTGTGAPGQQTITPGSYQTVASQVVTVGNGTMGLFDLNFEAQAFSAVHSQVRVRYLVDGQLDAGDTGVHSSPQSADTVEEFSNGFGAGAWHTLFLTHQLNLGAGNHTIAVQVEQTQQGPIGGNLLIYTPTLGLTGYNVIDGQNAADGAQVQGSGATAAQNVAAGAFQTIATLQVGVNGNKTGVYNFAFQAQALASGSNRVYVRYLIDGQPDPADAAVNLSATAADSTVDFLSNLGAGGSWHTLYLTRLLALAPGTHTISVQVECTAQGSNPGQDLQVFTPDLHLTGYNNITPPAVVPPSPYFNYNPATGVLIVNGTAAGSDHFVFSQSTAPGARNTTVTTYTFTMNGASVSYTASQVSKVILNGGPTGRALLNTNDTYAHGTSETRELLVLGAGGGVMDKFDAAGHAYVFMLIGAVNITANMGRADVAYLYGAPGQVNTFASSGARANLSSATFNNQVNGAQAVYAYSASDQDKAVHYDGSGPSVFTASGTAWSSMRGTDAGQAFFNEAFGFKKNYGIAQHGSNDVAIFYDSPANDVFVGGASYSYLYSDDASGNFAEFNAAQGFGHVYAYSFVGGQDTATNNAQRVNAVTGFNKPVTASSKPAH